MEMFVCGARPLFAAKRLFSTLSLTVCLLSQLSSLFNQKRVSPKRVWPLIHRVTLPG
jgi:hypothetical protein